MVTKAYADEADEYLDFKEALVGHIVPILGENGCGKTREVTDVICDLPIILSTTTNKICEELYLHEAKPVEIARRFEIFQMA